MRRNFFRRPKVSTSSQKSNTGNKLEGYMPQTKFPKKVDIKPLAPNTESIIETTKGSLVDHMVENIDYSKGRVCQIVLSGKRRIFEVLIHIRNRKKVYQENLREWYVDKKYQMNERIDDLG